MQLTNAARRTLAALAALANLTFVVYDLLIVRLEIFYCVKLRPKLHL